jgi:hypothetical protein
METNTILLKLNKKVRLKYVSRGRHSLLFGFNKIDTKMLAVVIGHSHHQNCVTADLH